MERCGFECGAISGDGSSYVDNSGQMHVPRQRGGALVGRSLIRLPAYARTRRRFKSFATLHQLFGATICASIHFWILWLDPEGPIPEAKQFPQSGEAIGGLLVCLCEPSLPRSGHSSPFLVASSRRFLGMRRPSH